MRLGKLNDVPVVTTLHFPVEWFWNKNLFGDFDFGKNKFVALSNFQKKAYELEGYKISQVIYNGIDVDLFKFNEHKKNYLFFLGRIHPDKGVDHAISAALTTGYDLIIAGDVITQQDYFNKNILPHITHDLSGELNKLDSYLTIEEKNQKIVYVGHVNRQQMIPLYQNAKAFLMTSTIGESCPLVALEAMSCGAPVLCFNKGSLPELVKDGVSGFVVDDVSALAESVKLVEKINPLDCRLRVENNFTQDRMVQEYVELYAGF
jgi:glycosyltransferase involved in cell wall biosynthesis